MLRYNMDKYASQNLDTLHISRRVRELLSINNIGQRLFAKYVLGKWLNNKLTKPPKSFIYLNCLHYCQIFLSSGVAV